MPDIEITSCGHPLTIDEIYAPDFGTEVSVREEFWRITEGDVVLDIGASVGIYTLPALACGAAVVAVDILNDPETSPLTRMARANGLEEKLTATQAALGDEDGYPQWLLDGMREHPEIYPGLADCEWTTVDRLVAGHQIGHVDWIKVDTEGGEVPILRGARNTLERDHPKLLIEEHSHIEHVRAAGNAATLRDLLAGHGYAINVVPYENRELWYCEAP